MVMFILWFLNHFAKPWGQMIIQTDLSTIFESILGPGPSKVLQTVPKGLNSPSLTVEKDSTPGNLCSKAGHWKNHVIFSTWAHHSTHRGLFSPICRAILRAIYRGSLCQSNHRKPSMNIRTLDLWRPIFKNINCTLWNKAHRKPKDYLKRLCCLTVEVEVYIMSKLCVWRFWKKAAQPWTDLISFKMHSKLD